MLIDVADRFNGNNNGTISWTFDIAQERGWRNKKAFVTALAELQHYGFLIMTRQGGRNRCSYFSLSWMNIQPGPHDEKPTTLPPNTHRQLVQPFQRPKRSPRPARAAMLCASPVGSESEVNGHPRNRTLGLHAQPNLVCMPDLTCLTKRPH
jgi:hypothetical protein